MSILVKGTDFGATEQVTSTKLDNLVDAAKFTNTSETAVSYTGSTGTCLQGGGLEVTTAGQLQIQDGEVDLVKLSTNNQLNSGLYGVLDKVYPVGSIYISTVSTNPDTLMFGGNSDTTWEAFGAGRTLVGINAADTDFDTAEETGGSKTHTLTTSEIPSHSHSIDTRTNPEVEYFGGAETNVREFRDGSAPSGAVDTTDNTNTTGGGGAHNNLQPYIVTYMWKRTA
jgi:hypothetical protein